MKAIYERFEADEFKQLTRAKQAKAKELGRKRISWHDFLMEMAKL